ncbi:MAG: phosphoserine phosphatase SerB [Bifidobacteriaceae bacterium]|nr:phosphoserine phosphatase SerB [Bifidobacteriaceae bacterium]
MKSSQLLVMDVDSTLTSTEGIDLLAGLAGHGPEVAVVTERAMRGELDFAASLHERVALLRGLPESGLAQATSLVRLSPGARELVSALHAEGWAVGAVSGGFAQMVAPLAEDLGLDFYRANTLEMADAVLTGRVIGSVVDRAAKARALAEWAGRLGLAPSQTAAIGDGANDLDMMAAAGLSIAYGGKPAVVQAADHAITGSLLEALPILRAFAQHSAAADAATALNHAGTADPGSGTTASPPGDPFRPTGSAASAERSAHSRPIPTVH